MSLLADTVYKLFARQIPGFEHLKADTIYRSFIKNYAHFQITAGNQKTICITLNKKVNLPLLYQTDWFDQATEIPWLNGYTLLFQIGTSL